MKLKAGRDTYKLPVLGMLVDVTIDFGDKNRDGLRYLLVVRSLREMESLRQQPQHKDGSRGRTAYCAIRPGVRGAKDELLLSPVPEQDGTLEVRYYPPMVIA